MSTVPSTPTELASDVPADTSQPTSRLLRPQRVLACVLCQQRKVKCDRNTPCKNCIKSGAQCVPSKLAHRKRRRRFPEQTLLERLLQYEDLLRKNNITFEPLYKEFAEEKDSPNPENGYDSGDELMGSVAPNSSNKWNNVKSHVGHEAKNIWRAMSKGYRDADNDSDSSHDEVTEYVIKKAWDQSGSIMNDDYLLLGSYGTAVELSSLHPNPAHIFRLWQIYLDNVNPVLKVTHTPSLQGRIVEAASDVTNIDSVLEALMFSIYCVSIQTLSPEICKAMFSLSKEDLLLRYQFGCRQGLANCGFLRTNNRECLTALYLYLVSIRRSIAPQSLCSMLGVAVRVAQRMGIDSESALTKCTAIEAEMRRRLWWSLVFFDTRVAEISNLKSATLNPAWDCKIPLNVNDSDLRPEMRGPPMVQGMSTEAVFAVVRGEVGNFVRHSMFHLDFTSPSLKPIAKRLENSTATEGDELVKLEEMIEDRYFKACDLENPIHFMTIWTTRGYLAKCRLVEHHSRFSSSSAGRTEAQRDAANSHALSMLECDTKIMTSPLTKGFLWVNQFSFPFPAYVQVAQDLRRRPLGQHARQAWEIMSENYEAWLDFRLINDGPFIQIFTKIILQAWEAYQIASQQLRQALIQPRMVSSLKELAAQTARHSGPTDTQEANDFMGGRNAEFTMPMPTDFGNQGVPYNMAMQDRFTEMDLGIYASMPGQAPLDAQLDQFGWTALEDPASQEGC